MKPVVSFGIPIATFSLTVLEAILYYNIGAGKTGRALATLPPWKTIGKIALVSLGVSIVVGWITDGLRMLVD